MNEENKISLLTKIEGPVIVGKIDLSKIDSSTRPKDSKVKIVNKKHRRTVKKPFRKNYIQKIRERIDSGWSWSFGQIQKNHKR